MRNGFRHVFSLLDRVRAQNRRGKPLLLEGGRSLFFDQACPGEHGGKSLALSTMCGGGLREEARRCEGEWKHPVEVAKFGKKIILQAAKMKLPDDGLVEKKAKQDGEQRKKRFQSACIRTVM